MTTWRYVILLSYPIVGAVCGIWSSSVITRMVEAVNKRVPENGPLVRHFRVLMTVLLVAWLLTSIALLSTR